MFFVHRQNLTQKSKEGLGDTLLSFCAKEFAILNVDQTNKQTYAAMVTIGRDLFSFSFYTPSGTQRLIIQNMRFIFVQRLLHWLRSLNSLYSSNFRWKASCFLRLELVSGCIAFFMVFSCA